MKFISLLIAAAASTALAKGDGLNSQCKTLAKLTKLSALAANETRLASKTDGNTTEADAIKAKATEGAAKLSAMQANTTLMDACAQVFAVDDMEDQCSDMKSIRKLQAMVADATALDEKTDGNATKAEKIKAKAEKGAAELAAMEGNSTLTAFCAQLQVEEDCKDIRSMAKDVAMASNDTALQAKFDGNATKIEKFKAKAAKMAEKLTAAQANTTLTDACAQIQSLNNKASSNGGATGAAATENTTSAAVSYGKSTVAYLAGLLLAAAVLL